MKRRIVLPQNFVSLCAIAGLFLCGFFSGVVVNCAHNEIASPPATLEKCVEQLKSCGEDINTLLDRNSEYSMLIDKLRRECR